MIVRVRSSTPILVIVLVFTVEIVEVVEVVDTSAFTTAESEFKLELDNVLDLNS